MKRCRKQQNKLQFQKEQFTSLYVREKITVLTYLTLLSKHSTSLIRLEEKLTNLESENKVLRQQSVSMAPNKFLSGRSRSIIQVRIELNLK